MGLSTWLARASSQHDGLGLVGVLTCNWFLPESFLRDRNEIPGSEIGSVISTEIYWSKQSQNPSRLKGGENRPTSVWEK